MPITTSPLIGVTSSTYKHKSGSIRCFTNQSYVHAIQRAGGIPLLIPVGLKPAGLHSLLQRLNGVLFTGGGDIDPQFFGGQDHPKIASVNVERDRLELELLQLALRADLPLLAICRGIQLLNVGLGGTLYTHIQDQHPDALKHDWYPKFPRDKIAHTVNVTPGSKLNRIVGETELPVNSLHHQGIARIGNGLEPAATAPDGLIEAVEVKGAGFGLGVQWHPECLPESVPMQKLFRAFITAC